MTLYLGVTAHYIDKDWALHSNVLGFEPIDGSHNGTNQATLLYNLMCKYDIAEKVLACTSYNASVNDAIMTSLAKILFDAHLIDADNSPMQSRCYTHILRLAKGHLLNSIEKHTTPTMAEELDKGRVEKVVETSQEVEDAESLPDRDVASEPSRISDLPLLFDKIQKITAKISNSPNAKKYFRLCCIDKGIKPLAPVLYCKARWGSWHRVIKWLLKVRKGYTHFCAFADAEPTVPKINAKNSKPHIWFALTNKQWKMLDSVRSVLNYDEFAIAKRSTHTSDDRESCPQAPLTETQRRIKQLQKASLAFRGSGKLSDEFDRYISSFEEDDSLSLLAATPGQIQPDFVLQWWKRNEFAFPIISGIARDFLAIPASSVPCKHLFSYAKLADTEKRRCMSEGTFSKLQTLGAAD
ncbi:hypothetical protein I350_06869 [Cryptococcus amylolentus CBS 6273]|uniref:HAT C-terminal dimerisation domain-containing protein n=1 Tax=Cryptococcus amylolentus CBS 6273 TaxID=1296118 RepID=A0A1E3JHA3_9TREE|nr:hypothetical protein I350_06869 [Cryptococcus amylolentus CBS 6273]